MAKGSFDFASLEKLFADAVAAAPVLATTLGPVIADLIALVGGAAAKTSAKKCCPSDGCCCCLCCAKAHAVETLAAICMAECSSDCPAAPGA